MKRNWWMVLVMAVVVTATVGTGCGPKVDEDLGPIEEILEFSDRINWPGVDQASGRVIPFIRGFGNGTQAAYWFLGFASRRTADSFWFCREGDDLCPLDENERLNWDNMVGHPLFTRIPGDNEFSPFWQMWKVTVPDDYEPETVKTIDTLRALELDGTISSEPLIKDFGTRFDVFWGPQEVLLHCALVLTGTTLAENGEVMPNGVDPMMEIPKAFGWNRSHRVEFFDFSVSDGIFPEAEDSENRPLMPFANIYIHWRTCDDVPPAEICNIPGYALPDRRPVSERGLGEDITNDTDANDTNNVIGSMPCELIRPEEKAYSPLWRVNETFVTPGSMVSLVDTTGDQMVSDMMSADNIFDAVALGLLTEPEPQTEDSTGNPVPGNEGEIFFNCPNPVPVAYVPFPCN